MTPEVLLRLTLLQLKREKNFAGPTESPESSHKQVKVNYASKNEFCDAFITLWTQQLARRTSHGVSLPFLFLFFLPAQWTGKSCDCYYLREENDESADLQYLKDHDTTQMFFRQDDAAPAPLFQILDELVALLQPKLPQLQPTLKEWTAAFTSILASLRSVFLALHGSFLTSFTEVDRQLSDERGNAKWDESRRMYCLAVSGLCRFLDAQLLTIVARTIVMHLESASGCLNTALLKATDGEDGATTARAVASVVKAKLVNIAASVGATTKFQELFPYEAEQLRLPTTFGDSRVDSIRGALLAYLDKLNTATRDNREGYRSASLDGRTQETKAQSASSNLPLRNHAEDAGPVSLDQAYSLVAPPESETLAARVADIVSEKDDALQTVEHLLVQQQSSESRRIFSAPSVPKEGRAVAANGTKERSGRRSSSAAKQPALSKEHLLAAHHKSSHKDTWVFWTRVQRKLGLEDVAIQRISEACKFEKESPFPGIFLIDLDVRNNDRTTASFVDMLRDTLPSDASVTMTAKNTRLLKQACASFAEELLEKSRELQRMLPFLPLRVDGVLLGSLYAVLRADKQFQSLKQIYQQKCQLPAALQRGASDRVLHTNVETLIMKRVHFLAKPVAEDDSTSPTPTKGGDSLGGAIPRWSIGTVSREPPRSSILGIPSDGTEQPRKVSAQPPLLSSRLATSPSQQEAAARRARRRPSVMEALAEARRSVTRAVMPIPPPETRIEKVYLLACRFHGVTANSALARQLAEGKENYVTTLDLSSNYVGVKGLKPVLELLSFNGSHLISLSLCNNNLESEDVVEVCQALEGSAGENLAHLDLSFNPVTPSSFEALQKLCRQLSNLESLLLKATLLPPDAVQDLQRIVARRTLQRSA